MAFDPSKFGAIPVEEVESSSNFDPAAFGAVPVDAPSAQPQQETGFLKSLAQDVAQPFARIFATALDRPVSNMGREAQPIQNPIKAGGLISPQGGLQQPINFGALRDTVGVGAEIGSQILAGGAGKKVLQTGLKTLVKQGIKTGTKEGAKAGGLYAFGRELQAENPTLRSVVGQSALGTVLGGTFGGAIGAVTPVIGFSKQRIVEKLNPEAKLQRIERLEQRIANEYRKSLNLTKRLFGIEAKGHRDTALFLAKEGIPLNVKDGKLDSEGTLNFLRLKSEAENTAFQNLLYDDGGYINIDQARQKALSRIKDKGTAKDLARDKINREFEAYIQQNADNLAQNVDGSLSIPKYLANELKQDAWSKGYSNPLASPAEKTEAGASRLIGTTFMQLIEDNTDDVAVRAFNRRLGDLAEALFILQERNGQPVVGGRLSKWFARTLGGVAGAQGGPIGTVAGAIGADKLADMMMNPSVRTWYMRNLLNRLGKEGKQDIVEQARIILQQRAKTRAARPLLGTGTGAIPLEPESGLGTVTRGEAESRALFRNSGTPVSPNDFVPSGLLSAPSSDFQGIPIALPKRSQTSAEFTERKKLFGSRKK